MRKLVSYALVVVVLLASFSACEERIDPAPEPSVKEEETQDVQDIQAKNFLKKYMGLYYYWYKDIPSGVKTSLPIEKYFDALLVPQDRWSWMTDAESYLYSESGVVVGTYGASLAQPIEFYDDYDIRIRYVYPGSPFDKLGVTRGWTLTHVAGTPVMNLIIDGIFNSTYYVSPQTFTFTDLEGKSHTFQNVSAAKTLNTRPALKTEIFTAEDFPGLDSPVGYFLYMGFESSTDAQGKPMLDDISEPVAKFKAAGCKNIILDLRYNSGGSVDASDSLVNLLASSSANGKVYTQRKHNDILAKDYDQSTIVRRSANSLDLDNLYIITGEGTASASEMVLNGLKPLMSVHHVGDTTYGKPNGMYVLMYPGSNADYDNYERGDFSKLEYVFLPICFYNKNGLGQDIPDTGIVPDNYIADDLYHDFGVSEKNIKACLYHIVNGSYPESERAVRTKSAGGRKIALAEEDTDPKYGKMTVVMK